MANITLSANIKVLEGYSSPEVRDAVDAFLTDYLSPSQYPFTTQIRKNQLIADVAKISGVDYVDSLTMSVNADSSQLASVSSGDIVFNFKGTLPVTSVTVGSI